jgi:hypothetical protein
MNYRLKGPSQFLGAAELPDVKTYSIDELKSIGGFSRVTTTWKTDPNYWQGDVFKPGGTQYNRAPFNWIDLPKNHLEFETVGMRVRTRKDRHETFYQFEWIGRGVRFKDPNVYLDSLSLITDPLKFITYLKYAPVAGFNISQDPISGYGAQRVWAPRETLNGAFQYKLPDEVFSQWWMEVLTWHFLQTSFTMLRMAQIEDMYDLDYAYNNAGKFSSELIAEMWNPAIVSFTQYGEPTQRIELELRPWEIEKLKAGINEVRHLIDENRKKMAARLIQLQDVDAEIVETEFAVDPLQNPYLVYDQAKSEAAGQPTFVNVARNASATWAPPEITTAPENMQYWEQVPEFERERARVYMTEQGPMSLADLRKYGMEREKTNWVPWLAAGAAVAYAASEML